jgi:hypothetical protein
MKVRLSLLLYLLTLLTLPILPCASRRPFHINANPPPSTTPTAPHRTHHTAPTPTGPTRSPTTPSSSHPRCPSSSGEASGGDTGIYRFIGYLSRGWTCSCGRTGRPRDQGKSRPADPTKYPPTVPGSFYVHRNWDLVNTPEVLPSYLYYQTFLISKNGNSSHCNVLFGNLTIKLDGICHGRTLGSIIIWA